MNLQCDGLLTHKIDFSLASRYYYCLILTVRGRTASLACAREGVVLATQRRGLFSVLMRQGT